MLKMGRRSHEPMYHLNSIVEELKWCKYLSEKGLATALVANNETNGDDIVWYATERLTFTLGQYKKYIREDNVVDLKQADRAIQFLLFDDVNGVITRFHRRGLIHNNMDTEKIVVEVDEQTRLPVAARIIDFQSVRDGQVTYNNWDLMKKLYDNNVYVYECTRLLGNPVNNSRYAFCY